ncbi:DUF4249 domain-containing protein [Ulvibacterium sp.]|uniref:DUF4249 domain-containing protein n=1 Tax=Ulvibacterium sp. TaxID=2665914 RepID=UPI002628B2F2|nr:DUF4249 domain-containing protein [Ulvibacterium sp.]
MIFTLFGVCIILGSCTEPFSPEIPPSDSLLVVDATLTNELKNHKVFLSRTTQGDEEPTVESNATVRIVDDNQQQYPYTETEPGTYVSDVMFSAEPDRSYRLRITTASGREYASSPAILPPLTAEMTDVYAERTTTDSGLDGMGIFVNSFDANGNSIYYKYEYEETYKIIAPRWVPHGLVIANEDPLVITDFQRDGQKTCFATEKSNTLILNNTSGVGEDRITGFNVRFINRDNYIISHRYSLLVKQFVLSRQAFEFYETLQDFSGVESLFSDSQPGFIVGNIFPQDDGNDQVVGIFEVSSVSEQRVFFNYSDFFPDEDLPPFVDECPPSVTFAPEDEELALLIRGNLISFNNFNERPPPPGQGRYFVQPRVCGDCTALGTETIPDFWEE